MSTPSAPTNLPNGLPNNPVGRRLHAQTQISAWLADFEKTATEEGKKEVLRIQRFLGFVEKSTRAPRTASTQDKPTTPAASTTTPAAPTTTPSNGVNAKK